LRTAFIKPFFKSFGDHRPRKARAMHFLGISISASTWLAPMTALAATAGVAAIILLRDHLRLERQALALEADVVRLTAEMNRVAASGRREDQHSAARQVVETQPEEDRSAVAFAMAATDPAAALPRELRAPLGGIVGLTLLLLDSELDGAQMIHAKRIKALAEDLMARIEPPLPATPEASSTQGGNAARVLLAEDDEVNGLFAVETLAMAGAMVDRVRDGAEAVAAIESAFSGRTPPYDLVLMDIRMPRMSGLDATRHIRALETRLQRTDRLRIVAVTATAMPQDRQAAIEAGISDFLAKPYRASHLAALLAGPVEPLARAS
jgi:CheY-like chemotaxis protein